MLDDLNDLLSDAVKEQKEAKAVKDARKRVAATPKTAWANPEDRERIAAWENANMWQPRANVARFVEQSCANCGDCQYIFTGLLERQTHRQLTKDGSQRWVATDARNPALPDEVLMAEQSVPMCIECCEGQGFVLSSARWEDGTKVEWADADAEPELQPQPTEVEVAYAPL